MVNEVFIEGITCTSSLVLIQSVEVNSGKLRDGVHLNVRVLLGVVELNQRRVKAIVIIVGKLIQRG